MNCMKCGRETAEDQVFCQDCLLDMEKYPVKPGTAVQLPKRNDGPYSRKNTKRRPNAEEQVKTLRKRVRLLTILLILALVVAAALAYPAAQYLMEDHFRPGQNYSSITVTTAPSETATEPTR